MGPLVSIVMPTYNAEPFIADAINSVLAQTYPNWELLIVNDGSTDGTAAVIERYRHPRIRVFHQANTGIGGARNLALDHARGTLLCTLDSDDVLPPESLSLRVDVMLREPGIDIVDGIVMVMDRGLTNVLRIFRPSFTGDPHPELIALRSTCFFGPSWMLRWEPTSTLRFSTEVTHAEDLLFYLQYGKGKRYVSIDEAVLIYRVTGFSAMSRLDGLERSYRVIAAKLAHDRSLATPEEALRFNRKWRSIMFRTWLKARKPWAALRSLLW